MPTALRSQFNNSPAASGLAHWLTSLMESLKNFCRGSKTDSWILSFLQ